jgi:uncharacterized BrkB/YihY/UPF0761 family membrane protein
MPTASGGGERLRLVGVGVLSGLVVGLPAGVAARVIMRLVALDLGQAPVLTLDTLNVLATVLFDSVLVGLLFVVLRRQLPAKSDLGKGALFGLVVLLLALLLSPGGFDGDLPASPLLGGGLFAILCLLSGIATARVVARLETSLPAPRARLASIATYSLVVLTLGLSVLYFVFTEAAEPPAMLSLALAVADRP